MPVPERFTVAAPGTPSGEAINVGQMYTLFAQMIRDGKSHQPIFETAVDLHRLPVNSRRTAPRLPLDGVGLVDGSTLPFGDQGFESISLHQ
jgi:hypothetical protein